MHDPGADFIGHIDEEQLEALVETMYLVAFADGEYGEQERAFFAKSVAFLSSDRLAPERFDPIIGQLLSRLSTLGREGCVASIKHRLKDHTTRAVALILAQDMAAADGKLHPNERRVLKSMAYAFDIGPEDTREVLDGPVAD